jgi:hypothetical protein
VSAETYQKASIGPPSEAYPMYRKVKELPEGATATYMIVCDEGWRESIVCEGMYEYVADWLLGILRRKRFARSKP